MNFIFLFVSVGAATFAVLVLLACATRTRAQHTIPRTNAERAAIWQRLHRAQEVDPLANAMHRTFLQITYALAAPFARFGVQPNVVTLFGLWVSCVAVPVASRGSRWVLLSAMLVVTSAVIDGVDGAVAGITQRSSLRGKVLDSVVDRLAEACFVSAVVFAGAASFAGVIAIGCIVLFEYVRAQLAHAALLLGKPEVGIVTIAERPTRVIGCAIALLAIGIAPSHRNGIGTNSLLLVAALSVVGLAQLARHAQRALS